MIKDPAGLRVDYDQGSLSEQEVQRDPVQQFKLWFDDAILADLVEPNAMTLATVDANGRPAARVVLLKGYDERGFVFYTNTHSRKGEELAVNDRAALLFWWDKLHRQVRIEGAAQQVDPSEADDYYASRPYGSRIGAWASEQSAEIASRELLEQRMREFEAKFPNEVPRPSYWSGYRVVPDLVEFWQGRRSRLHDRLCYRRDDDSWNIVRLAP